VVFIAVPASRCVDRRSSFSSSSSSLCASASGRSDPRAPYPCHLPLPFSPAAPPPPARSADPTNHEHNAPCCSAWSSSRCAEPQDGQAPGPAPAAGLVRVERLSLSLSLSLCLCLYPRAPAPRAPKRYVRRRQHDQQLSSWSSAGHQLHSPSPAAIFVVDLTIDDPLNNCRSSDKHAIL
jgi:hypothetical protein